MDVSKEKDLRASRIVGGNSSYKRREGDFYPTPRECTVALLDHLGICDGARIWEPACGDGHIVSVLLEKGYDVIGTDIQTGTDFLSTKTTFGADWIITNPPFSLAEQFIQKCINHRKPFALLLKSQFWHAKGRYSLFTKHPPTYVLPLTWRPDFTFHTRGRGSPLMDVCWNVWLDFEDHETIYQPLQKPEVPKK